MAKAMVKVGDVYESKQFGSFEVVEYIDKLNILVKFYNTGFITKSTSHSIRSGGVKDYFAPSVFDVGVRGDKYKITKGKGTLKLLEYDTWYDMLRRCYGDRYKNSSYEGCTASDNFKYYTFFYEWCNKQVGFGNKGWHLDKDLLVKGNKIYSEDTCVFLPAEINSVLTKTDKLRGKYPIGVHWCNSKKVFVSQINRNKGQQEWLGQFDNPNDAFNAYKDAKENYLKELANKWKGKIDERAYNALMNYKVEITD